MAYVEIKSLVSGRISQKLDCLIMRKMMINGLLFRNGLLPPFDSTNVDEVVTYDVFHGQRFCYGKQYFDIRYAYNFIKKKIYIYTYTLSFNIKPSILCW